MFYGSYYIVCNGYTVFNPLSICFFVVKGS